MILACVAAALPAGTRATPPPEAAPERESFRTLPPGATLPDGEACARRVRRSEWEPRRENRPANRRRVAAAVRVHGASDGFNARFAARVDGAFAGTTDEIIQWAACKWGFDVDIVRAVAMRESRWRQAQVGDGGESFGILQVKRSVHEGTFPAARDSTAFNVDYALAWRRACYDGDFIWLNGAGKRGGYAAGDEWGCVGTWFSGDWRDQGAQDYIARVQDHLAQRSWRRPRL